jgi:hypothetical protein
VQPPNPRKWLAKLSLKKEKRYRRRRKTDNALRKWRNSMACTSNSRSKRRLRVNPSCCHKLQSPLHYCLRWNLLHRKMIQLRWRQLSILIQQMSSYLNCPSLNRISPRSRDLHFTTSTSALLTEGQALMLTILNIRKHYCNNSNRRRRLHLNQVAQLIRSLTLNSSHLLKLRNVKISRKILSKKMSRWISRRDAWCRATRRGSWI